MVMGAQCHEEAIVVDGDMATQRRCCGWWVLVGFSIICRSEADWASWASWASWGRPAPEQSPILTCDAMGTPTTTLLRTVQNFSLGPPLHVLLCSTMYCGTLVPTLSYLDVHLRVRDVAQSSAKISD